MSLKIAILMSLIFPSSLRSMEDLGSGEIGISREAIPGVLAAHSLLEIPLPSTNNNSDSVLDVSIDLGTSPSDSTSLTTHPVFSSEHEVLPSESVFREIFQTGDRDLLERLLSEGLSPHERYKDSTLLWWAIFKKQPALVKLLLDFKATPTEEVVLCLIKDYKEMPRADECMQLLIENTSQNDTRIPTLILYFFIENSDVEGVAFALKYIVPTKNALNKALLLTISEQKKLYHLKNIKNEIALLICEPKAVEAIEQLMTVEDFLIKFKLLDRYPNLQTCRYSKSLVKKLSSELSSIELLLHERQPSYKIIELLLEAGCPFGQKENPLDDTSSSLSLPQQMTDKKCYQLLLGYGYKPQKSETAQFSLGSNDVSRDFLLTYLEGRLNKNSYFAILMDQIDKSVLYIVLGASVSCCDKEVYALLQSFIPFELFSRLFRRAAVRGQPYMVTELLSLSRESIMDDDLIKCMRDVKRIRERLSDINEDDYTLVDQILEDEYTRRQFKDNLVCGAILPQ